MRNEKMQFLTKATLKEERGWTEKLVSQLLPQPDQIRRNPHNRSGPRMKLYCLERIERIEKSEEFTALHATAARRKQAALRGMETRKQELEQYVSSLKIVVPVVARDELEIQAHRHHQDIQMDRGRSYGDGGNDGDLFLHRICVNYLRHQMTEYEAHLSRIAGKVGCADAYEEIKTKVLDPIAEAYPWLSVECWRQQRKMHESAQLIAGR